MVRVKVCGLRKQEQALAAARMGADLLGLVLAPSSRHVTVQQAGEIAQAVRKEYPVVAHALPGSTEDEDTPGSAGVSPASRWVSPAGTGRMPALPGSPSQQGILMSDEIESGRSPVERRPLLVGVFVNQPLAEVQRAAAICGLDYTQLHGDETPEYCRELGGPFIKALRVAPAEEDDGLFRRIEPFLNVCPGALFLLDTHVPGVYGGTGRPWEWERAARLAGRCPILLAGGLTPETVAGVVRATNPWGVDVSTGVETNGTKDLAKVQAFIEAVRSAERDPYHGLKPRGIV